MPAIISKIRLLLKIRQTHYDNSRAHFLHCQRLRDQAKALSDKAIEIRTDFANARPALIEAIYHKLIGHAIPRRQLDEARQRESALNHKLERLKMEERQSLADFKTKAQALEKALNQTAQARKNLSKAEEVLERQTIKSTQRAKRMANLALDEFALGKRSSLLLSVALWFLFDLSAPQMLMAQQKSYYRAINQPLSAVFKDVASQFDLIVKMRGVPRAPVKGIYEIDRIESFFNHMTNLHQLDWFIVKDVIYITPRKTRKKRTFQFTRRGDMRAFIHYLNHRKKVIGTPFKMSFHPRKSILGIEAPEIYLRYISQLHKKYLRNDIEEEVTQHHFQSASLLTQDKAQGAVMIFRLKNALASDKVYQFTNRRYSVEGVATLLRRLTGAGGGSSSSSPQSSNQYNALKRKTSLAKARSLTDSDDESDGSEASAPIAPLMIDDRDFSQVRILADKRLNAVLVYDDHKHYPYYKDLITHLDRKAGLVEIEAMIVDVSKDHINELGINWRVSKGRDAVGFGNFGNSLTDGAVGLSAGLGGLATALSSNIAGILAKIRFLETKGNSRVVSRPSVMTMDNLEAVINMRQRFFVKVEGYQDSSLYPVETGTSLRVTPHIVHATQNGGSNKPHIQLFIIIEDGTIDQSNSAMVDGLPSVQENKVSTQAVIGQGESLLIGGHIHTIKSNNKTQVPILGSIPLLGYLFRSEQIIKKEFIRLFIIRPNIYG